MLKISNEAKSLFAATSMNLRERASNSMEFMDFVPHEDQAGKFEHKVLGINSHLTDDTLSVPGPSINDDGCVCTKRKVLQVISSVLIRLVISPQPFLKLSYL